VSIVSSIDSIVIMIYRQVKRYIGARSRVVMTFVQPVMWIFFFGLGMGSLFTFNNPYIDTLIKQQFGGLDYITFLTSGVVAMTIFTASFISGVSVIWDKQFGFLKETLVAPAHRASIIIGRSIGDALTILLQATIITLISKAIAPGLRLAGLLPALIYGFILSLGLISLGIAIATKMTSPEGFQMIVNLIMMPLQFLSGIFFPISRLPDWAQIIAKLNPLTYAVDGMRYWLTGVSTFDPLIDVALLVALSGILMIIAVRLFEKATIEE